MSAPEPVPVLAHPLIAAPESALSIFNAGEGDPVIGRVVGPVGRATGGAATGTGGAADCVGAAVSADAVVASTDREGRGTDVCRFVLPHMDAAKIHPTTKIPPPVAADCDALMHVSGEKLELGGSASETSMENTSMENSESSKNVSESAPVSPEVGVQEPFVTLPNEIPRFTVQAVFDRQFEFVWRLLRRFGVAEADAESAVYEVFAAVHRKLSEYATRGHVATWLSGICYRVAGEVFRGGRGSRSTVQAKILVSTCLNEDRSFGFGYEGRDAIERLDNVLNHLELERRAVFVMYEIEGLSAEQISEALEIPVTVVYGRLETARQEFDGALTQLQVEWIDQNQGFA